MTLRTCVKWLSINSLSPSPFSLQLCQKGCQSFLWSRLPLACETWRATRRSSVVWKQWRHLDQQQSFAPTRQVRSQKIKWQLDNSRPQKGPLQSLEKDSSPLATWVTMVPSLRMMNYQDSKVTLHLGSLRHVWAYVTTLIFQRLMVSGRHLATQLILRVQCSVGKSTAMSRNSHNAIQDSTSFSSTPLESECRSSTIMKANVGCSPKVVQVVMSPWSTGKSKKGKLFPSKNLILNLLPRRTKTWLDKPCAS